MRIELTNFLVIIAVWISLKRMAAIRDVSDEISNTFLIRKKEYCVSIYQSAKIVWKHRKDENTVSVRNILSIKLLAKPAFAIFYAKQSQNKWKVFKTAFHNNDMNVCQMWIEMIQRKIDGER